MTQDEEKLLREELCMRLPYSPYVHILSEDRVELLMSVNKTEDGLFLVNGKYPVADVKLYLKRLGRVREEDVKPMGVLFGSAAYGFLKNNLPACKDALRFVMERYLDFGNLINMELAIEAPYGMYGVD